MPRVMCAFKSGPTRADYRPDRRHRANHRDLCVRSELWPYRGIDAGYQRRPIGHEYCGIVEHVGSAVIRFSPASSSSAALWPPTIPALIAVPATRQLPAERLRRLPGGTDPHSAGRRQLVATPEQPTDDLIASRLSLSDVMGRGWHAPSRPGSQPGMTVAVVGDGAVGLCGVLAASNWAPSG